MTTVAGAVADGASGAACAGAAGAVADGTPTSLLVNSSTGATRSPTLLVCSSAGCADTGAGAACSFIFSITAAAFSSDGAIRRTILCVSSGCSTTVSENSPITTGGIDPGMAGNVTGTAAVAGAVADGASGAACAGAAGAVADGTPTFLLVCSSTGATRSPALLVCSSAGCTDTGAGAFSSGVKAASCAASACFCSSSCVSF